MTVAESKLAKFVEDIIVPPRMIDIIVDGEVFLGFNGVYTSFHIVDVAAFFSSILWTSFPFTSFVLK